MRIDLEEIKELVHRRNAGNDIAGCGAGRRKIDGHLDDLIAEVEQLREIVKRLPRTADGVSITPEMMVYRISGNGMPYIEASSVFRQQVLYSTREAAVAASKA